MTGLKFKNRPSVHKNMSTLKLLKECNLHEACRTAVTTAPSAVFLQHKYISHQLKSGCQHPTSLAFKIP
jgi:hypothetical protein